MFTHIYIWSVFVSVWVLVETNFYSNSSNWREYDFVSLYQSVQSKETKKEGRVIQKQAALGNQYYP